MSGRIVGEVLRHAPTDLRPLDLLVLVSLAESAHDKDRTARRDSSAEAIAYRVRTTPGYVRQCILRLKKRGLIRPVHKQIHKGQAQNWIITELSDHHREAVESVRTNERTPDRKAYAPTNALERGNPVDNSNKALPRALPRSPQSVRPR